MFEAIDHDILHLEELIIPTLWPCERDALRPPEIMAVSEWANRSILLLPETSREPGPYRWQRTPYVKAVIDMYAHPDIRHIVLKWATQVAKTTAIYNILGYIIDQDPYPTLIMYPSDDESKLISRTRIQPMIEKSPVLRTRIPADRSKYQLLEMHFPGMVLYMASGNSVTSLAQRPVRNLLRDEVNKYPAAIGDHGDPMDLSEERLKGFQDIRKVIDVSSPTTEQGNITRQENSCQVVLGYYVPCPSCGRLQMFEWAQIKFDNDHDLEKAVRIARAKASAYYECKHCEARINDQDKEWMLAIENGAGWYMIADEDPGEIDDDSIGSTFAALKEMDITVESVAFRLSSIYSPWITFGDVAEKFLQAHLSDVDRFDKLRSFNNDWLGQEWTDVVEQKTQSEILNLKCELLPLIVPKDAVAITCGIDHQKKGLYYSVWAWAPDLTRWMIEYGLLTWDMLFDFIYMNTYQIEGNRGQRKIWRAGIDTGGTETEDGSMTAQVYRWIARFGGNTVFALKGANRELDSKVKMDIIGKIPGTKEIIPGSGIRLWKIDTAYFKDLFASQLQIPHPDPGCVYLHKDTQNDFAHQLASEVKRRNKKGRYQWVRVRGQNHHLDTSIYAGCLVDPMFLGGLRVVSRLAGQQPQVQMPNQGQQDRPEASRTTHRSERKGGWW